MDPIYVEPEVLRAQASALEETVSNLMKGEKTAKTGSDFVRANRRLAEVYSQLDNSRAAKEARQRARYAHLLFPVQNYNTVVIGDLSQIAYGIRA